MNTNEQIRELTDEEMTAVAGGMAAVIGAIKLAKKLSDATGGATFANWQQMARDL